MRRLAIVCDTDRGVRVVEDDVRCDRCAHWETARTSGADLDARGCDLLGTLSFGARIITDDEPAWLETRPDFGCALFTEKTDETKGT